VASADDLARLPLFAGLEEDQLAELASWFEERSVAPGTRLIGEGAAGYSFFVMVHGAAVATSDEVTLAELEPGDFFGEIAILGDGRRTASVTTTAPSAVLTMFGTEFRRLQASQPAIADAITDAMQARLAAG
jgi:CRP-like cAMP-binding protein